MRVSAYVTTASDVHLSRLQMAEGAAHSVKRRYDVVLTDVMMPGTDGWEVARAVRRVRPDVGIVVLSGTLSAGEPPADDDCLGRVTLLAKPVTLGELQDAVEQAAAESAPGTVKVGPYLHRAAVIAIGEENDHDR